MFSLSIQKKNKICSFRACKQFRGKESQTELNNAMMTSLAASQETLEPCNLSNQTQQNIFLLPANPLPYTVLPNISTLITQALAKHITDLQSEPARHAKRSAKHAIPHWRTSSSLHWRISPSLHWRKSPSLHCRNLHHCNGKPLHLAHTHRTIFAPIYTPFNYNKCTSFLLFSFFQWKVKCARPAALHIRFHWEK